LKIKEGNSLIIKNNMGMKDKMLILKKLYYSTKEVDFFQKEAEEKCITFSEAIRRALDFYIDNSNSKNENK
jgi:hypothetical protein